MSVARVRALTHQEFTADNAHDHVEMSVARVRALTQDERYWYDIVVM